MQLGETAARLTVHSDPSALDALAAAYAAAGRFDEAVEAAKAAVRAATSARLPAFAAEIRERQSLYEGHRAFRIGSSP